MTEARVDPVSARPAAPPVSWYALVGPAFAWSAQELSSTVVSAEACIHGQPALGRAVLVAIGLVALGVTTSAGLIGYRRWQRVSGDERLVTDEGRERSDMLALVSVVLSVVLTLAVLWCALPALMVADLCGARR